MSTGDRTRDHGTLPTGHGHKGPLVRQIQLQVVGGPDAGKRHSATGARIVVGTHEAADLILTDATVSRFHCELVWIDDEVHLRDLGSRNGTVLSGGVPVLHAKLPSGVTLTLGNTRIRFELGKETVPLEVSERDRFGSLVGESVAMRQAFAVLERAAAADVTVLLEGETGTGKEGAAEGIHAESARQRGPFVVVDCGAIPDELLESELFGHERGAFTGAVAARKGAFEAANGGTIFLDEIGELPLGLQPTLLRALEKREIKRVGATAYQPVDVRVIAATHRNLREDVNKGRFRADLYYRLAVLRVALPSLRERLDDLPRIVDAILEHGGLGGPEAEFVRAPEFLATLAQHGWQGNVRELRNYLERCIALRAQAPIDEEMGATATERLVIDARLPLKEARENVNRRFEKEYVTDALARHDGNVQRASRAAGVGRMYFYRLLWKHGIRTKGGADPGEE